MQQDCLFCKILAKEIPSFPIYENTYVYAFLDVFPNSDGHTLIIPKQHFTDFGSTSELYLIEVAKAKKIVRDLLQAKLDNVSGFNYVSNEQAIAGQVIFHYHEHIVPKYIREEGFLHNKNVKLKYTIEQTHQKLKNN